MSDELIDPGSDVQPAQDVCICHGAVDSDMLQCSSCSKLFHQGCLKSGRPSSFAGDVFFEFTCASCSPDEQDSCTRLNLSWQQVVYLTLYNLFASGSGKKGYFHWREDICHFIDKNWSLLLTTKKRTNSWCSTIAGVLSNGSPQFFKSGQQEFKEPGWWALQENVPPSAKLAELGTSGRKKRREASGNRRKKSADDHKIHTQEWVQRQVNPQNSAIGCVESVIKTEQELQPVQCTSTADKVDMDTESDELIAKLLSNEDKKEMEELSLEPHFALPDFMELDIPYPLPSQDGQRAESGGEEDERKSEDSVVSSAKSTITAKSEAVRTKSKSSKKMPEVPRPRLAFLSEEKEKKILSRLNSCPRAILVDPVARRFRRKLMLRQLKRSKGLPLFDLDKAVCDAVENTVTYVQTHEGDAVPIRNEPIRESPQSSSRHVSGAAARPWAKGRVLDRFLTSPHILPSARPRFCSFSMRLVGGHSETLYRPITSPYTARLLKPFIRRDFESRPLKLRLLEEIIQHKHKVSDTSLTGRSRASIDYCYVQPHHIPAVNSMCRQFFWSGIDLSDCLQYPDFSCVVLYRKFVIGFAFMVPDVKYNEAYISFIFVHPEWRRAGIGTYMLYHLIQTCMGKDVTLHVSATNPAMMMYQQFGFKPEEFILDFYDRYLPENSPECRHAFFLRLKR